MEAVTEEKIDEDKACVVKKKRYMICDSIKTIHKC